MHNPQMANILADLLTKGARMVGNAGLGKGTGATDATASGDSYRKYRQEQEAQGLDAVSAAEFAQGKR
jgi:hypothetical protein